MQQNCFARDMSGSFCLGIRRRSGLKTQRGNSAFGIKLVSPVAFVACVTRPYCCTFVSNCTHTFGRQAKNLQSLRRPVYSIHLFSFSLGSMTTSFFFREQTFLAAVVGKLKRFRPGTSQQQTRTAKHEQSQGHRPTSAITGFCRASKTATKNHGRVLQQKFTLASNS